MDYTPYDGQKMARKILLLTHQVNTRRCWYLKPKNQQFGFGSTSKSTTKNKPYKQEAKKDRTDRMMLELRNDTGTVGWCSCTGLRRCFFYHKGLNTGAIADIPTAIDLLAENNT